MSRFRIFLSLILGASHVVSSIASTAVTPLDIDSSNINHHRLQQNLPFLPLLSDACQVATISLYADPTLLAAYDAYTAAEQSAFQDSCYVPLGGTPYYECDVNLYDDIFVENFESACALAGGTIEDFGLVPHGIGCCGEIDGQFAYYGSLHAITVIVPTPLPVVSKTLLDFTPKACFKQARASLKEN